MVVAGGRVLAVFVCLSVCFSSRYLENAAARITKLGIELFLHESWKPIYFWVKRSKFKVTKHRNSAGMGFCTFMSATFF